MIQRKNGITRAILTEGTVSLQSSACPLRMHREHGLDESHLFFEILQGKQAYVVDLRDGVY